MADKPIYGLEALRRFREQQARQGQAAKEPPAREQTAKGAAAAQRQQPRLWLKANASADEYAKFQKLARAANLTLANYIRKRLGLPLTHPGRPRRAEN